MSVREEMLTRLNSQRRNEFLARLLEALAIGARGEYSGTPDSLDRVIETLECVNELTIIIATQLRSGLTGDPAYPDDAFMDVLAEKVERAHYGGQLRWAAKRAIGAIPSFDE